MLDWVYVHTSKIKKMAYNAEIETMYIDFIGSTVDTPYKNVSEKTFNEFSQANDVDEHYEMHIKSSCQKVEISTENIISCDLK